MRCAGARAPPMIDAACPCRSSRELPNKPLLSTSLAPMLPEIAHVPDRSMLLTTAAGDRQGVRQRRRRASEERLRSSRRGGIDRRNPPHSAALSGDFSGLAPLVPTVGA